MPSRFAHCHTDVDFLVEKHKLEKHKLYIHGASQLAELELYR